MGRKTDEQLLKEKQFAHVQAASREFRKANPTPKIKDWWNHGLNPITMKKPEIINHINTPVYNKLHALPAGKANGFFIITN